MQVMETRKKVLGAEHSSSMSTLALAYWNHGRWEEAEKLQVLVLETREKVIRAEPPDMLTNLNNLTSTHQDHGR